MFLVFFFSFALLCKLLLLGGDTTFFGCCLGWRRKKRKFFLDSFWKKNWTCGDDNNSHDLFWNWLFLFSDSTFMLSFTNAPIRVARRYYYRQQPARSIHPIRLLCVCKLIHDKECVYIYRAFFISRTPFITGLATAPLSFSIRKESGATKLNAITLFLFRFFFFKEEKWWTWWKWRGRVILWVSTTLNRVIKLIAPCVKVKHEKEEEWQCQLVYGSYHLDVE